MKPFFIIQGLTASVQDHALKTIGVDSGGAARARAPPIIRMEGKTPFLPPQ